MELSILAIRQCRDKSMRILNEPDENLLSSNETISLVVGTASHQTAGERGILGLRFLDEEFRAGRMVGGREKPDFATTGGSYSISVRGVSSQ